MANPEHVAILKQGVEAWNSWRRSHPGVRADLCHANLSGIRLYYNLHLAGADISGADLSDAKLMMADLTGVNLTHTDLCRADLSNAALTGATLAGTFLFRAKLTDADLTRAELSKANLSKADLSGANLSNAILSGSDLFGANLWEANLEKAGFEEANLCGANLTEANLSGTILRACHVGYTAFINVNLTSAQELATLKHLGPSYIDVSTLFNSGANIPESFLRGCGVPEVFIRQLTGLFIQPVQFHSCFISYSTADRPFAWKLHEHLQARGVRCWLDEHQVRQKGVSFKRLDRGMHAGAKVLLCCSRDSLTSWWVDNEIDFACERERRLMQDRGRKVLAMIPMNLDGYLLSDEWRSGRKEEVLSRIAPDFRGWENDDAKFDEPFEQLVQALKIGAEAGMR